MRRALLCLLTAAWLPVGCASPGTTQPAPAQASMPDGRDLAEHPLDVLGMPQP